MKKYGVVLIGCGHIGQQHLEDIYYRENISIVGVVDTVESHAALFAAKYGAQHYSTDYRELVALPETDIVIIATWVRTHYEILQYCIRAGKHILCEKPLCSDPAESEKAFALIENAPVKVQLALILRHNRSYQKIQELISDGAIGTPTLFRMVQNHHAQNWSRYQSLLSDCPSFFDCGIHYFDVASWFTGSPIQEIHAEAAFLDSDCTCENYGIVHLKTQSGCTVIYEAGWGKSLPADAQKLFVGSKGYITLTLAADRPYSHEQGDLITVYHSDTDQYELINQPSIYKSMYMQLCALIHSIETGDDTTPSTAQAKAATMVAFAAVESAHTGKTIHLDAHKIPSACTL